MSELGPGTVVAGRYRLKQLLGQGGMGSVWLADNISLDAPCAVKFIHGEAANSPDLRARFEREAKAAAQLRSPNVVQILDHGIFEGTPYMAMELLEGEDLQHRVKRMRQLHPREVASIIAQTGRALSKAHAMGLVHRDLKPGNIFLVRDDDREIVKVLDFGVAKVNASGIETSGLDSNTKTGAVLGTPFYMSPEQGRGIKAVDSRADLWSLAVVVYQCLVGRLPFQSDGLGDLLIKIMVEPPPIPSRFANVPAGFDGWWAKATAREINDRFQTAKEFSDALTIALGLSVPGSELGSSWSALKVGMVPTGPQQVHVQSPPSHPLLQQSPPSHPLLQSRAGAPAMSAPSGVSYPFAQAPAPPPGAPQHAPQHTPYPPQHTPYPPQYRPESAQYRQTPMQPGGLPPLPQPPTQAYMPHAMQPQLPSAQPMSPAMFGGGGPPPLPQPPPQAMQPAMAPPMHHLMSPAMPQSAPAMQPSMPFHTPSGVQTASPIVAPLQPVERKKKNGLAIAGIAIGTAAVLGIVIAVVMTRGKPSSASAKKPDATSTTAATAAAKTPAISTPTATATPKSTTAAPTSGTASPAESAEPSATAATAAKPVTPTRPAPPVVPQQRKKDFGI